MRLDNFINTHSRQTTKLTDKPCHHHLNYFHFVPSCEWVSECVRVLLNLLLIWLIRFIQLSLENRQHFINFNLRGCLDRVTAQIRLSCPIDQNSTLVHRDTHADTISSTREWKKLQTAHTHRYKFAEFYDLSMRAHLSSARGFFSHSSFFNVREWI